MGKGRFPIYNLKVPPCIGFRQRHSVQQGNNKPESAQPLTGRKEPLFLKFSFYYNNSF